MEKENKGQALAPWVQALKKAEPKFMAISGREEQTKIELGFAFQLIQGSEKLKSCNFESIINAVINVARTGITLNPVLKLAHLVPRDGKCILDFDYKGLVKVLKDNKCLKDIQAVIVYEDEKFFEGQSQIHPPVHIKKYAKSEADHNKRGISGVYSQVVLLDNTVIYTPFMPYWEILKTEKTSKAASSAYSPWKTWREEMIKKTKLKRDFKTLIAGSPTENAVNALEIENANNGLSDHFILDEEQVAEVMETKVNEKKESMKTNETKGEEMP